MGREKIREAVGPRGIVHAGHGVKSDRRIELIHGLEERNEFLGMQRSIADDTRNDDAIEPELLHRAPGLFDGCDRILDRHQGDSTQPFGRFAALLGDIIVVGAAHGRGELSVFEIEDPNQCRWINDLKVDFHPIHIL